MKGAGVAHMGQSVSLSVSDCSLDWSYVGVPVLIHLLSLELGGPVLILVCSTFCFNFLLIIEAIIPIIPLILATRAIC